MRCVLCNRNITGTYCEWCNYSHVPYKAQRERIPTHFKNGFLQMDLVNWDAAKTREELNALLREKK